jgi:predicted dehydrogenase
MPKKGLGDRLLRGAMLGTGSISIHHMRAWRIIPGVKIVALANRTREKAVSMGREFGVDDAHIYADYRELLDRETLDFVDVATAPAIHREQILAAAAHGVHVLCQKPFATSLGEAREMIAACDQAGVRCIVHENWRWRRWFRELKQTLNQGTIGTPRYARFQMHSDAVLPPPDGRLPHLLATQTYMAKMPHLILYEWGVHLIDVMRFLFGDVQSVYARMSRVSPVVRGEDMATLMLAFESGLTGIVDISWGSCSPRASDLPRGSLEPFVVEGDKGTVEMDPQRDDSILITTACGTESHPAHPSLTRAEAYQESYFNTFSHVLHCLRSGEPAETEAPDNLKTLEVAFASYESAEHGQVVKL